MYRRLGFAETHCVYENGFNQIYMRWSLADGEG